MASAEGTGSAFDGLPLPETLLAPLLDVAAATLSAFEGDVPAVLRPLAGFDPRRLGSGPARQQLRRALEVDPAFRSEVVERFLALDEAADALASWSASLSLRRAEEAAERSDLALVASVLYAAQPDGWSFGLGVICVVFDRRRADKERADDAKAREMQTATLGEARRRAEAARDDARAAVSSLEEQLREERKDRRDRELKAQRAIDDTERRDLESGAKVDAAELAVAAAEARLARESMRAREAEQQLRDLRRDVRQREQVREERGGLDASELRMLADATGEAQRLATRLEGLTKITRHAPATTDPDSRDAARTDSVASSRRVQAPCPAGLVAGTADGLDAMLRTRSVQLVVDGYNVSMAGRGDAPIGEQRDWLLACLTRLHLRLRCVIVVVFDGADVDVTPERRTGVRVVFSAGGEKADPVVVREVAALPASTPAIVVSSDRWVQEHSVAEGAISVPAEALVELLRR